MTLIVSAHQSGKGYMAFNNLKFTIINENACLQMESSCQSSQEWACQEIKSDHLMLSNLKKNPSATSSGLHDSVSTLQVYGHDSTIRKILNKYGFRGRVAGKKVSSLQKIWQHELGLNNCICTNNKVGMYGHHAQHHVSWKPSTPYHHYHLIPTVNHGGGWVMIWSCFEAAGPGRLAVVEIMINSINEVPLPNIQPTWAWPSHITDMLSSWQTMGSQLGFAHQEGLSVCVMFF